MDNLTSLSDHSDYLSASTYSDSERWQLHRKRVEFGKQPLEIWQFFPCKLVDGVWVVLEETHLNYNWASLSKFEKLDLINEYQEAKDRVLFEGFEYSDIGYWYLDTQENGRIMFDEENIEDCVIEDLVKYNLELTPTALKQNCK